MDKATRKNIQRATQRARRLLEDEFREQLEGTFDILLDGTVAAAPGAHLSEAEGVVREKLVAVIAHKRATGLRPAEAVDAYLREAAFTTLNRFVALKMLEARGLVQECISRGDESSGFKEFTALAPGLVALPDKGYRLYIETLFDEIGREVRVLFDRRDVASLLWPRRQALGDLLGLLNDPELARLQGSGLDRRQASGARHQESTSSPIPDACRLEPGTCSPAAWRLTPDIWSQDETIGWVYQYFNGDDERRKMRDESQAPRNSRELAVRNQFFTPRYVVQFLTDNTLGRIWYEMMRGETKLRDLDYLVRRQAPGVRRQGETDPAPCRLEPDACRLKKDPRDLRVLDPACGSGHFLLYAFDLLLTIYEEAWADSDAAVFTGTDRTLREDYPDRAALRREIPGLILSHNLHGIDIDPRCAQIAALALWMRAQRAHNDFGLSRADRPAIAKTNIVVAEPMPGDAALVEEFAATLRPPLLGTLFKKMVEEMKLAGELGSLLKIEEAIAGAVRQARHEYVAHRRAHEQGYLPGLKPKKPQGDFDFSGIDDERFFEEAEEHIVEALGRFAESAAGGTGVRRRLFAGDAAQGVSLIDLIRRRFDAVLMNPPFGDATPTTANYVKGLSPGKTSNIYAAFIARGLRLTCRQGIIGCISSRTFVKYRNFEHLRRDLVTQHSFKCMVDLGWGVLDGAQVETAAFSVENSNYSSTIGPFYRLLDIPVDQKGVELRRSISGDSGAQFGCVVYKDHFSPLPGFPLCYWSSSQFTSEIAASPRLSDLAYVGLGASPHAFFFRAWWECSQEDVGSRWVRVCRGGNYSPFYRTNNLVIDSENMTWRRSTGVENPKLEPQAGIEERGLSCVEGAEKLVDVTLVARGVEALDVHD